jgi:RNA recognition motif-containing protein
MNLFISNISRSTKDDELRVLFQTMGEVTSVKIINDKYTGESKGFGFVDMRNDSQALDAIQKLTNTELGGRKLVVSKAHDRKEGY